MPDVSSSEIAPARAKVRWWWLVLLAGFGALGIYLGAPDLDLLDDAWARLRGHWAEAIAIVAAGAVGLVLAEALRIAVIGRLVGARVGARDAWDAAVANHVMTAITPQVGLGEPTVAYLLGRRGVPWDAAVAIPFIKFTSSLALVFCLGALLLATGSGPPVEAWLRATALVWFLGIAAVSVLVIVLFSRPTTARRWIERLAGWIARRRRAATWKARVDRAAEVAIGMVDRLARALGNERPGRGGAIALVAVVHLVYYASYVAPLVGIALVLGDPPIVELALRSLIYLCFIFASPTPGGTGTSEAAAGLFFADLVAPADAIIAVVVFRAATYYLQLAIGALYLPIRALASSGR
jgi:glycosyltransferase 2 family protein